MFVPGSLLPFACPLLLIAYRRPHCIRQVIAAIRPLQPTCLYVACDGAPSDNEAEQAMVAATRQVIEEDIDWPCQIHRLYSDVNQGCSVGPVNAISWFYEHVEEGIVLEDDCVPHVDFLPYCAYLLDRYRQDSRVWCISGSNFQQGAWRAEGSYYFSRYPHGWGWASWRRCWQHFDARLEQWPTLRDSGLLETIFEDSLERSFWAETWQNTYAQYPGITWWDYQWTFACLVNGGLTALPNRNLVTNVGFGPDATHTLTMRIDTNIDHTGILPMRHPSFVLRDACADRVTFDYAYNGVALRKSKTLAGRLRRGLSKAKVYLTSLTRPD
jgi:hypothetical protein